MPTTTLDIFRYQPDTSEKAYRQSFELEHDPEMTLLDAILTLQNEQDGTLAIRYSCRSSICGSCACKVNGKTVLACMSQVEDVKKEFGADTIQVDPMGNFAPQKDLIVNLDPFWEKFRSVKPYLIPDGPPPERERIVSKEAMQRIYKESKCILCAACYSECNSLAADPDFVGPAAFAWGYRFAGDERDGQRKERAKLYSGDHGIWDCTRCMYCNERCPKGVDPRDAIEKLGGVAFAEGVTRDKGARHAKAFLISMRTGGKLNETLLVPYTDPIKAMIDVPFALQMLRHGKAPSPIPAPDQEAERGQVPDEERQGDHLVPQFAYYPGCIAEFSSKELDATTKHLAPMLDIELLPMPAATCCGAGDIAEAKPNLYLTLNVRILSQAEEMGVDVLTICNVCTLNLRRANKMVKDDRGCWRRSTRSW